MELPVKKKILYIAGYSRSGSTILDIILSSHPQIFGTGELGYLFDDWIAGTRLCTCEQNMLIVYSGKTLNCRMELILKKLNKSSGKLKPEKI
jgi:hypothetical protein